jgi:uncharacterized protein (UPF0333 family)
MSGWTCLTAALMFLAQTSLSAFSAEAGRGGEPIAASRDGGEPVSDRAPAKQGSSIWGIVAGATVIVAGGVIGYLLGDKSKKDKDDAKDAAAEAAASADAAAGAAAAAGAPEATGFKHTIYITGEFRATTSVVGPLGTNFTPSITFSVTSSGAGGVVNFTSSATGLATGQGGDTVQTYDDRIRILINDGYYLGDATVFPNSSGGYIRLRNGTVLDSFGSAKVVQMLAK